MLVNICMLMIKNYMDIFFLDSLCTPKKLRNTAIFYIYFVIVTLILGIFIFFKKTPSYISLILTVICVLSYLVFFYKEAPFHKALLLILLIAITAISEIFSGLILIMLDISVETFEQIPFYSNLQILISSGVMFFCVLLIKVTNNRKVIIKSKNLLFLYPTICIIVLFMFSKTIERSLVNVSFYKVYIIITMLFLISNLLIVYVIKRINNVEMENEKLNFTNRYLKIEKQHQENLVELHNETRKIQHDLKSGLLHISGLLKAHNYTECINLLDKLLGLVYNLDLIINTGYSGLDALLSSKLIFAKTKSVQIVTLIALPDKDILIIDEFDLSLICGNILDNAIEATEKCFKSKHTIEFQMTYDSSTKLLRICCQNPTISKNSTLVTTKKDKFHHGFGLNNIKDISKKWKGMVQHDISNGIFSIIVTLHNDL